VDGTLLWTSEWLTEAWAHDGIVFAPNGDLIVGDFHDVIRINAADGTTVWSTPRSCPVSGNCGGAAAVSSSAVYIDESAPGGNEITKLDIETGDVLYSSPVMAGFTDQNAPFVSPDETTVYFSRTQNNPAVDYLYAFEDDGTQFIELWRRPVRWTTSHEHGIAADGSIYTFTPEDEFVRLDPATGEILSNAGVLSPLGTPNLSPKTAVDAAGNVYVSNGWASTPATDGRLWAFNADLSETLFVLNLDRQNAGGPAIGVGGTMIVADRQGVYAYRTNACAADLDGDWDTDLADLALLLSAYGTAAGDPGHNWNADFDNDGDVDLTDLALLLAGYGCGS
jgi:outer membrane protein assembly factor BamB